LDEVKKDEEESIVGVEYYMPARHPYFVRSMRKYEMRWLVSMDLLYLVHPNHMYSVALSRGT